MPRRRKRLTEAEVSALERKLSAVCDRLARTRGHADALLAERNELFRVLVDGGRRMTEVAAVPGVNVNPSAVAFSIGKYKGAKR